MVKLHRNTCEAVVNNLEKIFNERKFADKVIESSLKSNPKWGSRDRKFIAETTYSIVRFRRLLAEMSRLQYDNEKNNVWLLLGAYFVSNNISLPAWGEFEGIHQEDILARKTECESIRKTRESIPDWLDTLGEKELGEQWERELRALNKEAPVVVRANTLKISKEELIKKFSEIGIKTFQLESIPNALIIEQRQNLFQTMLFKEGLFELQDAASQLVAQYLDVQPGMRVIDACAGAGGKTLHIASLMGNKGKIIALDTEEWKLNELKKRAKRNGVSIIETRTITSSKIIKRLAGSADRLLLDVPCSGLGVLRRNPDAKWKLSEERIIELKKIQQDILNSYPKMVKVGGKVVYATCSILPSENNFQIQQFLSGENGTKNFSVVEEKVISPADTGFDGFYICVLRRIQ